MNQDEQLIYEAYQKMILNEAPPIELSGEYKPTEYAQSKLQQQSYQFSSENIDDTLTYILSLFPAESEDGKRVLTLEDDIGKLTFSKVKSWLQDKVKGWILSEKDKISQHREDIVRQSLQSGMSDKEAKQAAVDQVRDPWPNATKVGWSSRVIANDMLGKHNADEDQDPFISIVDGGKVQADPKQIDDVKDDIKRDIETQTMPPDPADEPGISPQVDTDQRFMLPKTYMLDPGAPIDSDEDKEVKQIIIQNLPLKFTGKELVNVLRKKMSGVLSRLMSGGFENARNTASRLLAAGILVPEEEEESQDRTVDIDDFDDDTDSRWVADDLTRGGTETIGTADW